MSIEKLMKSCRSDGMSLIDKIKSGMSEVGNKAMIVVEVNKLRLINVSKQNEINSIYKKIGEKVAQLAQDDIMLDHAQFASELEQINILKFEIQQNNYQINNLGDDKQCSHCGHSNPIDARVCSSCQVGFPIHEVTNIEQRDSFIELTEKDDKFNSGSQ